MTFRSGQCENHPSLQLLIAFAQGKKKLIQRYYLPSHVGRFDSHVSRARYNLGQITFSLQDVSLASLGPIPRAQIHYIMQYL